MPRFQDLTGQKFERLTVVKRGANVGKSTVWICKCDCGNEVAVRATDLKNGHTQSCGCLVKEGTHKTHGETRTRLYRIWLAMKARCKYDYPHLRNSYA